MAVIDDLETRVRQVLRDQGTEPRATSAEIKTWLADSQDEICERAYALEDRTTEAVCKVTMVAATASYTLHNKVILIESAELYDDDDAYVAKMNVPDEQELYNKRPSWRTDTGVPTDIVITRTNSIIVSPIPTSTEADYYLMLVVKRRPLYWLSDTYPIPEISSRYAPDMINWACYKYYLKDDVDTQDMKQAAMFLGLFEQSVGTRPSAYVAEAIKQQARYLHVKVKR